MIKFNKGLSYLSFALLTVTLVLPACCMEPRDSDDSNEMSYEESTYAYKPKKSRLKQLKNKILRKKTKIIILEQVPVQLIEKALIDSLLIGSHQDSLKKYCSTLQSYSLVNKGLNRLINKTHLDEIVMILNKYYALSSTQAILSLPLHGAYNQHKKYCLSIINLFDHTHITSNNVKTHYKQTLQDLKELLSQERHADKHIFIKNTDSNGNNPFHTLGILLATTENSDIQRYLCNGIQLICSSNEQATMQKALDTMNNDAQKASELLSEPYQTKETYKQITATMYAGQSTKYSL